LPDVTELDAEDAVREMEGAGFRVRETERAVTDPAQDGVVLEQRPAAGERRTRGARVTLIVGRLQAQPGQPTPAPTP
jgi:serine/threonine-protein kinase